MTHHKTYRVSIALVKVTIACFGEECETFKISEGGHDRGLDLALDKLLERGFRPLYCGPAPRPEFTPHNAFRTEHYIVTTVPVEVPVASRDDSPPESVQDLA